MQVFIEELLEPIEPINDSIYGLKIIKDSTWVLHTVLYNNILYPKERIKIIEIDNVNYQTAYFYSSLLYYKNGFRIVALFKSQSGDVINIAKKEYYFSM